MGRQTGWSFGSRRSESGMVPTSSEASKQGAKPRFKSGQFFVIMCDIDSGAAGRRDARA